MEGERKLKKLLIRIATLSCIIVICFSSVAGCSKKNEEESENILSNKYYMGVVDFSVQVIKFNDDYVVEWIDCGFGRSEDKRTKYYGTYEIDGRVLKITLSGQSSGDISSAIGITVESVLPMEDFLRWLSLIVIVLRNCRKLQIWMGCLQS